MEISHRNEEKIETHYVRTIRLQDYPMSHVDGWPEAIKGNARLIEVDADELMKRIEIETYHDEDAKLVTDTRGTYLYKVMEEYESQAKPIPKKFRKKKRRRS